MLKVYGGGLFIYLKIFLPHLSSAEADAQDGLQLSNA